MNDETDLGENRSDLVVLGRVIGTFTGWDQGDTLNFVFYGFKPKFEGMPEGDMNVDYEGGFFRFYDDEGNETWANDIIERMKDIPRE